MIVRFCKASQTPVYPMWANNFRFERWSIVEVVGLLDTAGSVELFDAGGWSDVSGVVELARSPAGAAASLRAGVIDRPSISRDLYGVCVRLVSAVSGSKLAVRGRGGGIRGSRAPRCRRLRGASTELLRAGF